LGRASSTALHSAQKARRRLRATMRVADAAMEVLAELD